MSTERPVARAPADAATACMGDNIVHFARILRAAGLRIGTGRVIDAVRAVELVGIERREDVRATLAAVLLDRHENTLIFNTAFDTFFRDPKLAERLMYLALPKVQGRGEREAERRPLRLEQALRPPTSMSPPPPSPRPRQDEALDVRALMSFSDREKLASADFESMSVEEFALAERLVRQIELPLTPVMLRRRRLSDSGRIDLRRTLQRAARDPHFVAMRYSDSIRVQPPLVILLDISGSMESYTRMFLVFAHALMQRRRRVHVLVFGTRLSNITRALSHRDPDEALAMADAQVEDWRGGTRIAESLHRFNREWARRLLSGNASLMLVSDGLEREAGDGLGREMAQLKRFSRELIWLNPLLRFDAFEPRATGVRSMLPFVDYFLPMHNVRSLEDLGRRLRSSPAARGYCNPSSEKSNEDAR